MRRRRLLIAAAAGLAATGVASAQTRPDPNAQAVADGCQRSTTAIFTAAAPQWVYVNGEGAPQGGPPPPPQWVSGRVDSRYEPWNAAHPTPEDDPLTHLSYDFVVNVKADPAYQQLVGTGNDSGADEESGRLHSEREGQFLPQFAWAERGDRVTELGSWVWDCGHYANGGERTEFHPIRAIWLERNPGGYSPRSPKGEAEGDLYVSTDGTIAGLNAECAHKLKADTADFKHCVQTGSTWLSVNGDYHLQLSPTPRPSKTSRLVIRVVDRGSVNAPRVNAVFNDAAVQVTFSIDAPAGQKVVVATQVFAVWTDARPPVHLRVRFDSLLARRSMDGNGRGESTLPGQNTKRPGEWVPYWDVDGIWGNWTPTVLYANDGQTFRGSQFVDLYVQQGKPWRLYAFARECDFGGLIPNGRGVQATLWPCPHTQELGNQAGDDSPGPLEIRFRSPTASLGPHRVNSILEGSTCPPSNRQAATSSPSR